jgi:hypothetical protein
VGGDFDLHLGFFDDEKDAARAFDAFACKFMPDAALNFPDEASAAALATSWIPSHAAGGAEHGSALASLRSLETGATGSLRARLDAAGRGEALVDLEASQFGGNIEGRGADTGDEGTADEDDWEEDEDDAAETNTGGLSGDKLVGADPGPEKGTKPAKKKRWWRRG